MLFLAFVYTDEKQTNILKYNTMNESLLICAVINSYNPVIVFSRQLKSLVG
jgi:hypothetical protein